MFYARRLRIDDAAKIAQKDPAAVASVLFEQGQDITVSVQKGKAPVYVSDKDKTKTGGK